MSDAMEQDCDSDDALMFCENCKGPITKMKKFDNTGKQFCSKQCADSQNKAQVILHSVSISSTYF